MSLKQLSHDSYRVGWICPLEVEQIAAMEMLDEEHQSLPQPSRDTNIYNLGSINSHNVVIAGLPRAGNCPAATVVSQMTMTFPNLKYALLVGIGGGVPTETENGFIRLGHVVVGEPTGTHSGVIQYDHGKAKAGQFERKGFLASPPAALLNAAREVAVHRQRLAFDPIRKNVDRIQTNPQILRRFTFPGVVNDHLHPSVYTDKRPPNDEDDLSIVVHRGTIASGELVIKNAQTRDNLAQEHGVLCFEMEAAGVLTDLPCMVIRGISDYCDSHKNDEWHGYAAVTAAAYARQLFFHLPIEEVKWQLNHDLINFELPVNLSKASALTRFVARKPQLKKMKDIFAEDVGRRTAVVHGLGGIGKTQLAIAYVRQNRSDYSAIIWLNARDETALKQSFARAAEWISQHHPNVPYIASALKTLDLDETVKAVKLWLEERRNHRWLVVYDNYDHPLLGKWMGKTPSHTSNLVVSTEMDDSTDPFKAFDVQQFLPETDHGAILITTRSSMVKLGEMIHLRKLEDINDSIDILTSTSGRDDSRQDSAATDLARQLDGLPLALATAGAYLEQVSISYSEYLQLYRSSWQQLQEETPQLAGYDQTLYSTWNVSFRSIELQSPIAAMLLRQWAYFASEDLWYELLQSDDPHRPGWLKKLTDTALSFHTCLRLLCSHGLVEADRTTKPQCVESRGYSVHACVHSWMTHVLSHDVDKNMAWTAIECVAAHMPSHEKPQFWLIQRRLVAHADRCLDLLRQIGILDQSGGLLNSLGSLYTDQGRSQEAEALYKEALESEEKASGREAKSTLDIVNNLGLLYANGGQQKDAEAMFQRALEGYEKVLGREDISTLSVSNKLASLYTDQGRYKEAEVIFKGALEVYEKAWGKEHTSTLNAVNNLGTLYRSQGRLPEAETMYEQALEGYDNARGREHTSTLNIVNNLGSVYAAQSQLQRAEIMFERALEGYEKTWGQEHTSTLNVVNNLGNIYASQDRFQEAEELFKRAIEGYEKTWGREHTSTLTAVNNLGNLYRSQGRLHDAHLLFERALEGYEKAVGPGHLSTLNIVSNIASLHASQGRFQEAKAMFERVLEGYETALGSALVTTYVPALITLENLGLVCTELADTNNALLFYDRAISGTEAVFGRSSEVYSGLLNKKNSLKCDASQANQGKEISPETRTTKLQGTWKKLRVKLPILPKAK
ncbi:hypothetical protein MYU51_011447 [Penicillium brevicompactum]